MVFENLRKQHAVGQGFFHSAELHNGGKFRLRYVYDCGAMTKYARTRRDRINAYLHDAGARSKLDLLFISHVHADHLNGLPQLLHAKTGLAVDTIILPYFDVIERLIGYARAVTEDPAATGDDFYRDFVVSPVAALSPFRPRQILLVRSAGGDGPGAPAADGGPEAPEPDMRGGRVEGEAGAWKLVGRGTVNVEERDKAPGTAPAIVVAAITDSIGIAMPSPGAGMGFWLLSPFIDPAIERQLDVFKAALLKALNRDKLRNGRITKAKFDAWLNDPPNLKDLVTNRVGNLTEAFMAVGPNLNASSMCLYSGPLPDSKAPRHYHCGRFGKWKTMSKRRIGWLATGDADLKAKKRRAAFLRHYHKLLDEVVTLTLPHHGSEGNFHAELLTGVNPCICVVAADAFSNWRHPGSRVVQAVASHGIFLSVVTSEIPAEVVEWGVIG